MESRFSVNTHAPQDESANMKPGHFHNRRFILTLFYSDLTKHFFMASVQFMGDASYFPPDEYRLVATTRDQATQTELVISPITGQSHRNAARSQCLDLIESANEPVSISSGLPPYAEGASDEDEPKPLIGSKRSLPIELD